MRQLGPPHTATRGLIARAEHQTRTTGRHVAAPNLTRTADEQRAALVTVTDYTLALDLTDGAGRPGTTALSNPVTVRFHRARPRARSWNDILAAGVRPAVLNGTELDVSGY